MEFKFDDEDRRTVLSLNLAPQFTVIIFVPQLEDIPTPTAYIRIQLRHREVFSDGPCVHIRSLSNYLTSF
jgi:hypothetical protein